MLHELQRIIHQAIINQKKGLKNVLVTVVHLQGSSYRKPGVRMLVSENLNSIGAISGGCVEKEIIQQSKNVFSNNKPQIITYDGRYKLGCKGVLYILIEPFFITDSFIKAFSIACNNRENIKINSFFIKENSFSKDMGSLITFKNEKTFSFSEGFNFQPKKEMQVFSQTLLPNFQLIIIGAEHDAVKLCTITANLGWQVQVIASLKNPKKITDFPGATTVVNEMPETIDFSKIDSNTAIVIMNHHYANDLKYLIKLSKYHPQYIGILGAPSRRELLFNELFEYVPTVSDEFLETIYTPAGLHIGAETPEEIAISIIAEILSVTREKKPFSLRKVNTKIHH